MELSLQEVELAFQWLESPEGEPPPSELKHLNKAQWRRLAWMLESLLEEKQASPVH